MVVIHPKKKKNLGHELKYRTTRIKAFVWIGKDPKPVEGYAFVADIKKKGVTAFFTRKLPMGDMVLIAFETEGNQPFQAKIIGNRSVNEGNRTAKQQDFHWKCGLVFESGSEAEVNRFADYHADLRSRVGMMAHEIVQKDFNITEGKQEDLNLDEALGDIPMVGDSNDDGKKGAA